MEDGRERKRKKKSKKHSNKSKKMKRAKHESDSDEDGSSEGELQWVESTSHEGSTKTQPPNMPKREDWMMMHLSPSSGSLAELTRRKKVDEDKIDVKEVRVTCIISCV